MAIFAKHSISDVWQGSEYAFGLRKLFCRGSGRVHWNVWYLIGEKKVGEKWLNFLQGTKFFPAKFFPNFLFPDQYFCPIFFHLTKNLSRFFFFFPNYYYYYYYYHYYYFFPIYLQNLLIPCFFLYLICRGWAKQF